MIEKEKMDAAEKAAGNLPIFDILPYQQKKVGIVTTGSEIKKGLIQDTFTPVLREKLSGFPTEVTGQVMPEMIRKRSQRLFFLLQMQGQI